MWKKGNPGIAPSLYSITMQFQSCSYFLLKSCWGHWTNFLYCPNGSFCKSWFTLFGFWIQCPLQRNNRLLSVVLMFLYHICLIYRPLEGSVMQTRLEYIRFWYICSTPLQINCIAVQQGVLGLMIFHLFVLDYISKFRQTSLLAETQNDASNVQGEILMLEVIVQSSVCLIEQEINAASSPVYVVSAPTM